jgi:hypothetical protein
MGARKQTLPRFPRWSRPLSCEQSGALLRASKRTPRTRWSPKSRGARLGLATLAEGVENTEQSDRVRTEHIDHAAFEAVGISDNLCLT